jgi:multicomponent Na+:H+ antiporter subunit G
MSFVDVFTSIFCLFGVIFFMAGTIGLLRFPDVYCRLHALTKVDNLGLGLIVIGLIPQTTDMYQVVKLFVIWGLVLFASATSCHLIARHEYRKRPIPLTSEADNAD